MELSVGASVFYRDQRYWVETMGENFIRIADCHIRPEAAAPSNRSSFYVPVGLVEEAPTTRNRFGKQPTKKTVERRERQKADGTRDTGDSAAVLLRACKTIDDVYRVSAKYLGIPENELRAKYDHLNPGQRRMCCGNRVRAEMKRRGEL